MRIGGEIRMDCGLFCEECQVLYARVCALDDPAAWKELKSRATRVFLQALHKQVGALIPLPQKQRLAEHAIEVTRRRARLNPTWTNALRDARGVLARLVTRVLLQLGSRI